jgi:hypothetical protein
MTFSEALNAVRDGKKIGRSGWNGRKLGKVAFIVFQPGYPSGIPINANTSAALGIPEKTVCSFEPYLMLAVSNQIENPDQLEPGTVIPLYKCRPWTPDQRDQLAEDWEVIV